MKNLEKNIQTGEEGVGRVFKFTCLGAGIGLVAGAVGGAFLGEYANDSIELLKNSPKIVQYAVDVTGALFTGVAGVFAGIAVSHLLGGYGNIFREL